MLGEFDTIGGDIGDKGTLANVKFVAIAVAGTQTMVSLSGLMHRQDVRDQIDFVVRARADEGVDIGRVGARLVKDCQCFAMAGRERGVQRQGAAERNTG